MAVIVCLTTVHVRHDTRVLHKVARSLAASFPHDVYLLVADGKGDQPGKARDVSIRDLGVPSLGRLGRAIGGPWRALRAIRKLRPAVVHFHDPELIPLGLFLKVLGYTVVYDVHEDVPRQILSKDWLPPVVRVPISWIMSAVEWVGGQAFDAIVPATPTIGDRFPSARTVVVQNYPIVTELLPASRVPYAGRPRHFVYPGALAIERGIAELVQAVELLTDVPDAHLDLAGPAEPEFMEGLRALTGWPRVTYHGVVSRDGIVKLLSRARAGLVVHHPIPNEVMAQPIKLYEYMAAGLPIIASDFVPLRKVIEEVGCGMVVSPQDPRAVAEAMRWMLEHAAEAEAMGRRGREAVERKYSWDVEAQKLIGLYRRLLAPTPASAPGSTPLLQ